MITITRSVCAGCGIAFEYERKARPRKFCSKKCKWFYEHKKQVWESWERKAVELESLRQRWAAMPIEMAWVAGILEGEGCFTYTGRDESRYAKAYRYPKVQVGMTDEDVIRKVHRIIGAGTVIRMHPPSRTQHKPSWLLAVSRSMEAIALMETLLPHMGERRTQQIRKLVGRWKEDHAN